MGTLISAAALIVGLVLLWTWRRGLEVSSFQATLLSVIEVAGFVVSILTLGWIGVAIFIAVGVVAVIAWSLVLAIRQQSILVAAAVQSAALSREEAEQIYEWMGAEKAFAATGPLVRAELIKSLAGLARGPVEIRAMATAIAELSLVFGCDPLWLAPRFDQLLRLYGHEAGEASAVAATIAASTQLSAESFENMVEAMIIAGGGAGAEYVAVSESADRPDRFEENLRAIAELQVRADGAEGVRLNGGPMDGWLVLADAPSLRPDWYRTWPPGIAAEQKPGRYELSDDGTWAEWRFP